MSDLLNVILPVILGGGLLGGATAWYVARKKTPGEVDSLAVSTSEKAVLIMKQVLEAEQFAHAATKTERDFYAAEVHRKTARIMDLETKIDALTGGRGAP